MTDLEKFIQDHREQMDVHEPSPKIWKEVKKSLPGQSRRTIFRMNNWLVAAGISLILMLSFVVYQYQLSPVDSTLTQADPQLMEIDQGYAKQISAVQQTIDERQTEIKDLLAQYPYLEQRFTLELQQLDQTYQALKEDLLTNDNQEVLLKAMISNLYLQIEVLNNQLKIIQEIKNATKNENHISNI